MVEEIIERAINWSQTGSWFCAYTGISVSECAGVEFRGFRKKLMLRAPEHKTLILKLHCQGIDIFKV